VRLFALAVLLAGCVVFSRGASGAFPGKPGWIAFVSGESTGIWLIDAEGRNRRKLTPRLREDQRHPAWSPGGRWLMYTAKGLWIARVDGSGRRRIGRYGSDGAWSPDGRRIVFAGKPTKTACTDIYSMRLNGSAVRRLISTSACETNPSYSPDGKWIVFEAQTPYAQHIVVAPSTGGGRLRVIGTGFSPDWSPSGAAIAFVSGTTTIRVVDPSGRLLRETDVAGPDNFSVSAVGWSPGGDQFVFAQLQATGTVGPRRGGDRIYRANIDGSDRRELTQTGIDNDREPAWQPAMS